MIPRSTAIFLLAIAFLIACKKEKPILQPPPVERTHRIGVKLNQSYLPAIHIDSAMLIWESNGQVQVDKMQLSNDTLYTEIINLSKGQGRLTLQLYSKKQLRQQKLQWERRMNAHLKDGESIHLAAPVNMEDETWFPRVILIDAPTNFTAIVAIRPADPFFLLKNVPIGYKIELERNYVATVGGAVIVGGGLWKCNTVCTDSRGLIENREFFKPLPTQIGDREWKMVEIGIGLISSNHIPGPGFYFNHY